MKRNDDSTEPLPFCEEFLRRHPDAGPALANGQVEEKRKPLTIEDFFEQHPEELARLLAQPSPYSRKVICHACGREHDCEGGL